MNILIAGGTGMLGLPFTRSLLTEGHQVTILSRDPRAARIPVGAQVAAWDGRSANGWVSFLERADVLVNLAGENIGAGRWTAERKQRILSSRVQAGQAVVDALRQAKERPDLLLQASAIGFYGPSDASELDEFSPAGSDYLANICLQWEAATFPAEELGVRRVLLRTGIVLNQKGGALGKLLLPFRCFVGGPMGSGRQWWPWIHLHDQLAAMRFLITAPGASGAYNLCAPNPMPFNQFGRVLASVLHRPYWLPIPGFALRLLLGEMSTLVLDGQRALPRRLQEAGFIFQYPELRFHE
jgi:uncharacterized protein (TIGR01777 family)